MSCPAKSLVACPSASALASESTCRHTSTQHVSHTPPTLHLLGNADRPPTHSLLEHERQKKKREKTPGEDERQKQNSKMKETTRQDESAVLTWTLAPRAAGMAGRGRLAAERTPRQSCL
eukprot:923129-Rhodomonas_salina.2